MHFFHTKRWTKMDRLRQEEMKNINLKSLKFAKILFNVN